MVKKIRCTESRSGVLAVVLIVVLCLACSRPSGAQSIPGLGIVMTYNINEGTDYQQVQGATTVSQFLVGVGQIVSQVNGTKPPDRMLAIAKEIAARQPELVSLQEVDRWYTGSFDPITSKCGSLSLQYDMLQDLMTALWNRGARYEVAAQAQQYAFPPTPGLIPPSTFFCEAVNNYNVILARTDLPKSVFRWSNPQSGRFTNIVSLPSPVGPIPLPRVWASVDAQFFGHQFRLIDTHLEPIAAIRQLQAAELRSGPANTSLPVILAMDSNSQAFPLPQDAVYTDFISAGYQDVWSELYPSVPGLTCCQSEPDNNPVSQLYQRIDLILTQGAISPLGVALVGANPRSRTPDGLWPSDHAGVLAVVIVGSE